MKPYTPSYALTPTEIRFGEWLKDHHTGKKNSVTTKQMRHWGTGPTIREMVHNLRLKGYPICSDKSGYYVATTSGEMQSTISIMKSRLREIGNVTRAIIDTQAKLPIEDDE